MFNLVRNRKNRACHKCRISPTCKSCACQKTCFLFKAHILHMLKWMVSTFVRTSSIQALFKTCENPVLYALHFYSVRYVYLQSFKLIIFKVLMFCPGQSSNCKHKQRVLTLKLGNLGLRFLCNVLLLSESYLPTKFQVDTFSSSKIISRSPSSKCETLQGTITPKLGKAELWFFVLHFYSMRSINVQSVLLIPLVVLDYFVAIV